MRPNSRLKNGNLKLLERKPYEKVYERGVRLWLNVAGLGERWERKA